MPNITIPNLGKKKVSLEKAESPDAQSIRMRREMEMLLDKAARQIQKEELN